MLRFIALVAVVVAVAACDSATDLAVPGSTATTSSTTTTIEDDTCERVAADTVAFLDSLIRVLDDTRLAEFKERRAWPDDLRDLEQTGTDLDIRVAALGCDPAAIQQRALQEANLIPGGPLSEGLIAVLTTSSTTISTTTTPTPTTTEAVETTSGTTEETSGEGSTATTSAEAGTPGG